VSERRVTLGDLVRGEAPEVFAMLDRLPRPAVSRAPLAWAVLAGAGTGLFVDAALRIPLGLILQLLAAGAASPVRALYQIVTVIGVAAAVAVAWRSGGGNAAGAYVGILATGKLVSVPGIVRFCGIVTPQPDTCSPLRYLLSLWPIVLGIALAIPLRRRMRSAPGDRNPTLEAAGAFALAESAVFVAYTLVSTGGTGSDATGSEGGILSLLAAVAGGVACGMVIVRRATHRWRTLGLVSLAVVGLWAFFSLPSFFSQLAAARTLTFTDTPIVFAFAGPPLAMAAAVLVLYIAAVRAASRA
jgi:hypothetical protein